MDTDQDGRANEQGYYSADPNTGLSENYELDVDVNGDGEPDGVWIDIGMEMITLSMVGNMFHWCPIWSWMRTR